MNERPYEGHRKPSTKLERENEWTSEACGISVPSLNFLIGHKEEPAELHRQGAGVGDHNVADNFGIIQDAAEVHLCHLKAEVGVKDFPTQVQAVDLRVFHILNL